MIGYWSWELSVPPPGWLKYEQYLSEIWTLSEFCQESLSPVAQLPIRVVPPHIVKPDDLVAGHSSTKPGLHFLVMADGKSSLTRKNVLGSIEAYKRAFPDVGQHKLTLKLQNISTVDHSLDRIRTMISGRQDIQLMVESLSDLSVWELIHTSDVVLSLHRAEGFGLHLAEAMALGKIVIATDWSGNCDFMNARNSMLVPASLIPVEDADGVYHSDFCAKWADPDLDAASHAIRRIAESPELRKQLGNQAMIDIQEHSCALNFQNALNHL